MSERDYIIAKAAKALDDEYRTTFQSRLMPYGNKVEIRRGTHGKRLKRSLKNEAKGTAAGAGIGAAAGAGLGAAALAHPRLRRVGAKRVLAHGTLGGAALGGTVGNVAATHHSNNEDIRTGDIKITNRKTGKRATGMGAWGPRF